MSFFKNIIYVGLGSLLSQLIVVLTAPILSRLFSPSDFGSASIILSLAAVITVIVNLRFEQALVIPENNSEARLLLALSYITALFITLLTWMLLFIYADQISISLGLPKDSDEIYFIPLILFIVGIFQPLRSLLARERLFSIVGISLFIQSFVTAIVQIVLQVIWPHAGVSNLMCGTIIGYLLSLLTIIPYCLHYKINLGDITCNNIFTIFKKYIKFPLFNVPYSFATQASKRIILLILASFTVDKIVGFYALAFKLTSLPVGLVASAVGQVFYKLAATEKDVDKVQNIAIGLILSIMYFSSPWVFLFALNAEFITTIFLGKEWSVTALYAVALLPSSICLLMTSWLDRLYDVHGRQKLAMCLELIYDLIVITVFYLILYNYNDPLLAVWAYSLTTAMYNLIWLYVTFIISGMSLKVLSRGLVEIASLAILWLMVAIIVCKLIPSIIMALFYAVIMLISYFICYRKYVKNLIIAQC